MPEQGRCPETTSPGCTSHHNKKDGAGSGALPDTEPVLEQGPVTLADAHEAIWARRPARDADPQVWVAFHRASALVYSRVSGVDLRWRREALLCAGMEIRKARDIEHRINPELDGDES